MESLREVASDFFDDIGQTVVDSRNMGHAIQAAAGLAAAAARVVAELEDAHAPPGLLAAAGALAAAEAAALDVPQAQYGMHLDD